MFNLGSWVQKVRVHDGGVEAAVAVKVTELNLMAHMFLSVAVLCSMSLTRARRVHLKTSMLRSRVFSIDF